MLVDYERLLLDLKRLIAAKSHHGQRDLLAEIARLEIAHQLDEGLPEKALRLYGAKFSEDLLRPVSRDGRVPSGDGKNGHAQRGDSVNEEEANVYGNGSEGTAGGAARRTAGASTAVH